MRAGSSARRSTSYYSGRHPERKYNSGELVAMMRGEKEAADVQWFYPEERDETIRPLDAVPDPE